MSRAGLACFVVISSFVALAFGCVRVAPRRRVGHRDGWHMIVTAHVRLATDLDIREGLEAAWALEDFHRALVAAFVGCDGPVGDVSTDVTMMADGRQYLAVAPNDAFGFIRDGTITIATIPSHVVLPASPGVSRGAVVQTFAHELTHRFVHLCLRGAPVWLDEGLAMYFETVRVHEDELVLGAAPYRIDHTGPSVGIRRDGVRVTRSDAAIPRATELVALSPSEFYRYDAPMAVREPHYVAAWALVHWLLGGGDPAMRSRFLAYLAALRSGDADPRRALTTAFAGVDLDAGLAAYVRAQPSSVVHQAYRASSIGHPDVRAMTDGEVHARLAELSRDRDPSGALRHARAAEPDPGQTAHALLLQALLSSSPDREALIARAVASAPDNREVIRARAFLALTQEVPTAERTELRQTFARWQRPNATDLTFWASLELRNGNEQLAVSLTERALALAPDAIDAEATLGEALILSRHRAEGRAHLVAAMNHAMEHQATIAASIARSVVALDAHPTRVPPTGTPPAYPDSVRSEPLDAGRSIVVEETSDASLDLATFGTGCVGHGSSAPTLRLQVPPGAARAVIWVESAADVTLAMFTADGYVRCDDDSGGGVAPAIDDAWSPGEMVIWVGTFRPEDAGASFTLHVDASRELREGDRPVGCGADATRAERWGALSVGSRVVLDRHSPFTGVVGEARHQLDGSTNWAPEMDAFVGREAHVLYMLGTDLAGCAVARIDLDGQRWAWRLRDLRPAP